MAEASAEGSSRRSACPSAGASARQLLTRTTGPLQTVDARRMLSFRSYKQDIRAWRSETEVAQSAMCGQRSLEIAGVKHFFDAWDTLRLSCLGVEDLQIDCGLHGHSVLG